MSSQVPPNPITNIFNPSAWNLPDLSPEEEAVLDANYVKYPIAQNRSITFPGGITTSTLSSAGTGASATLDIGIAPRTVAGAIHHYSDGDNCVAGAGVHINNGLNNNSHTNIHNGTGANATGAVNIMSGSSNSGTITIGNQTTNNTTTTLRGNTTITRLATALTPVYSYPVATGNVGLILTGSNETTYPTANTPKTISTLSLDAGVWILTSFLVTPNLTLATNYANNHINLVQNTNTAPLAGIDQSIFTNFSARSTVTALLSINATTNVYVNFQSNNTSSVTSVSFRAVRIA